MAIVRWYPGLKLADLEKQVIEAALDFYATQTLAAEALGVDPSTIIRIKNKIRKEKLDEERSMQQLVASQNEAIRRIKVMSAAATINQERAAYQKTISEDRKFENSLQRHRK